MSKRTRTYAIASELRAAHSRTERACSSDTPGNHSRNWWTEASSSRFSNRAAIGTRVPLQTQAPLISAGSHSLRWRTASQPASQPAEQCGAYCTAAQKDAASVIGGTLVHFSTQDSVQNLELVCLFWHQRTPVWASVAIENGTAPAELRQGGGFRREAWRIVKRTGAERVRTWPSPLTISACNS